MIPLGQLALTTEVENYPGFPFGNVREFVESSVAKDRHWNLPPVPAEQRDGKPYYAVQGVELMELMKQQALNFETRVVSDDIVDVDFTGQPLKVIPANGEPVASQTVIVATGARANYLGLDSEEAYKNKGVSACAVCDGALPIYRSKPLAVIGGGDSAVEEATYLAKFSKGRPRFILSIVATNCGPQRSCSSVPWSIPTSKWSGTVLSRRFWEMETW